MADYERRAGRCAEHDDLAWLYDDGSIQCVYCLVVEISKSDCRWEPMPELWLLDRITEQEK